MANIKPTQAMIDLYDRFTHAGDLSRRDLMVQLTRMAGSAAAAGTMLGVIAGQADAAALVAADDPRIKAGDVRFDAGGRTLGGYLAQPVTGAATAPRVLVIHENRGLNDHIRDVARRLATDGLVALAADFLLPAGGTPTQPDGATSAEDVARAMIGKLDRPQTIADGVAMLNWLAAKAPGTGAAGAVGFCWGGGMVNALAVAAGPALRAGAAYYGAAGDAAGAANVKARLLLHYAGLDERINAMAPGWQAALTAAGVRFEAFTYPGVNHAFNNDTAVGRYDAAAAALAWGRTVALLKSAD
jgi:carboxymethylenebutenolidase